MPMNHASLDLLAAHCLTQNLSLCFLQTYFYLKSFFIIHEADTIVPTAVVKIDRCCYDRDIKADFG
jgi:hypothetical protein